MSRSTPNTSLPGVARHGISGNEAGALTAALVADALDALELRRQVLDRDVRPIQPDVRLVGWARPIYVRATDAIPDEPYAGEMAAIAALAPGDVPVYHVQDSVDAALFGELFSVAARSQGAVGAVLDGPVRDVRQMRALRFPVFARRTSPYDTRGRAEVVAHDVPVVCGGVKVETGDLVVADDDGVVVVPSARVGEVVAAVLAKLSNENRALADLVDGASVHQVWDKWRVF